MKRSVLRVLSACVLVLAGCHDEGGGGATSFDATVTDLIQNGTTETSGPIEVEGTTFAFPTSADAFDDVLPPDGGAIVPQ